jgi:hypothetical protein
MRLLTLLPGAIVVAALATASPAFAEIQTKAIDYTQGGTTLQGFIAWDNVTQAPTSSTSTVARTRWSR